MGRKASINNLEAKDLDQVQAILSSGKHSVWVIHRARVLIKQVKAWEKQRNEKAIKIHWSFTVDIAQQKLARHYYNVFNDY
jgi:hypothetical protein